MRFVDLLDSGLTLADLCISLNIDSSNLDTYHVCQGSRLISLKAGGAKWRW